LSVPLPLEALKEEKRNGKRSEEICGFHPERCMPDSVCFSVVRAIGCEKGQNRKALLPPNLILSRQVRPVVEDVWRRSPTFRLQCERISQAQWLRVSISFVVRTVPAARYRAQTFIDRGMGTARIEIYTPQNIVELIGHEFEHVVEQSE
jgi:hypothetical protein